MFKLYPHKTRKRLIHALLSMPLVTEFATLLIAGALRITATELTGAYNRILEFAEKQIALYY